MAKKETAIIISGDQNFISKYKDYLTANNIVVKNIISINELETIPSIKDVSCIVLDNTGGNFPYSDLIENIGDHQSYPFLLNIGKHHSQHLKSPFLMFTVEPEADYIPFKTFLENADRVFKREKAQTELASMLIHDIRSPLNSLIGYMELLLNDTFGSMNEGQKNIMEKAMDLGDTTLDMLEDLNEIFRGEQNMMLLEKEPFNFSEILESVLINIWVKADNKNIKIKKEIDPNFGELLGEDYQIQRVLTNLLTNAIKYVPQNSQIIIRATNYSNDLAKISVVDTGQGVPEEQIPRLFDKYFRVRQKKKLQQGYGLGLYICKLIIKAHSGKIWAENNELGGLTINFTLPFATAAANTK